MLDQQFDVDVVVTYVDDTDPVWQQCISQYNTEICTQRFRKWDNLRYWFRGIAQNMPFVRNVYLVVSNIEQVPEWVDQTAVKVILHSDIIPAKQLPTFNSTTIEMFLCKIPDLAEHFIYFNDDMFAMKPLDISHFFDLETGYPIYQLIERWNAQRTFQMQCRNSYRLAKEIAQDKTPQSRKMYTYIKHSADPMLKSDALDLWSKAERKINWSLSKFREPFNYTQYLFPDYSIFKGHWKEGIYDFCYYAIGKTDEYKIAEFEQQQHAIVCLNDSMSRQDRIEAEDVEEGKMSEAEHEQNMVERYEQMKKDLTALFSMKFPDKCKYEAQ